MKKSIYILLSVILVVAFTLVACGGGNSTPVPTTSEQQNAPPPEYANQKNPKADDRAAIEAGKEIFKINCSSCHGNSGKGDGPAASALDPKPQDLSKAQKELSDGYLFWRISEGGMMPPFQSTMPAWKSVLSADQIWQLVSYIRTLNN